MTPTPTREALRAELARLDLDTTARNERRAEIRAQLAALEAPASEERTDRCEGGDHTIGDRIGCEDCTLHTIQATRYWHNMRSVLRLYVESCVDRALQAEREKRKAAEAARDEQIEAQGTLCRMLNEERDSHTTTREQREAAEAEAAWIRNQLHSAQAAMDSSRSQHTTTLNALRELVEAVDPHRKVKQQDYHHDLQAALTRARALLAKEES